MPLEDIKDIDRGHSNDGEQVEERSFKRSFKSKLLTLQTLLPFNNFVAVSCWGAHVPLNKIVKQIVFPFRRCVEST
jgi:hypothetical protein